MIVLQAAWSPTVGELHLWGEDPAGPPHGGGRAKAGEARPHPFAASFEQLEGALAPVLGPENPPDDLEGELRTIQLPSEARGPSRSPRLLPDEPSDPKPPRGLRPWTVPTLFLPPAAALRTFESLDGDAPLPFIPSASLRVFALLSRLAEGVVRRGAFGPALAPERGEWLARWRPSRLSHPERGALAALERALPDSARAPLDGDEEGAPESAAAILRAALATLVDARVRGRFHPPAEAPGPAGELLARLGGDYPVLDGTSADEIEDLQGHLHAWLSPASGQALYTACFRLVPPEGDDIWRIEFALEHRDDPTLLVGAEDVWQARDLPADAAADDLQDHLLRSLGLAARAHRPLEAALRQRAPVEHVTDAAGAIAFLEEGRPLLEQAGFSVLVPPWWGGEANRLGLKLKARSSESEKEARVGGGEMSNGALLDFRWSVALGEDDLDEAELVALAASKLPLLRVRGQWVHVRPDEIEAALAALRQSQADDQRADPIRLLRLSVGLEAAPGALSIVGIEAEGALGTLLSGERRPEPATTPDGFKGALRTYQERGLGWLRFLESCGLGACLADDMGLGKTIQVLALMAEERADGRRPGATLLVCPLSVVGNWRNEAERFVPGLDVTVHHGPDRLRGEALRARIEETDLLITTYALATRDLDDLSAAIWHRVVIDEAQAIKNRAARQTRAIRSLKTARRVALTGTPVENRLSELHSIMDFLNPGLLGTPAAFRRSFVLPIERDRQPRATDRLRRLTQPFVLRRLKTDSSIAPDLPDKVEQNVECRLTREQATLYRAAVDKLEEDLEGADRMKRRGAILAAMTRLKQACNHPAQLLADRSRIEGRSGKLTRTEELLAEALDAGDKALVFTQFTQMGKLLHTHLQERFGQEVLLLHGGSSKAARDRMVARFQDPAGPRLFILSIKAGGTGLNLTAANHVVHFDRWWNPAVEDQATDRAYRIGQHRNVLVHKLVCVGTLEEKIDAMIRRKRALADLVVGSGEDWLTELSFAQLREVIALGPDAVEGA